MNQRLARRALEALLARGLRELCVCPGARNSPLVDLLLRAENARLYWFFDERAASFFALGRIKAAGRPVAVVTTSGTAAGELLPATMEAHYSALPLVLLTADRPRRFRGTGAPQTAEQVGIFGPYALPTVDLAGEENVDLGPWTGERPLHLNLCFEEPLLDGTPEPLGASAASPSRPPAEPLEDMRSELENFLARARHPLVIVGSLRGEDRAGVAEYLGKLGVPAYLEAHSGLREDRSLAGLRVHCADGILARARASGYEIDGVLRIGGVPTLRLWRDLENLGGKIPVRSVSREPFPGLSFGSVLAGAPATLAALAPEAASQSWAEAFLACDHALQESVRALLHREPRSEPALLHFLSRAIPTGARVFLGNSLPVREWDLAATDDFRELEVATSRGLNGIDGQASTFYGFCEPGLENWGVLGDLTALYDLQAPWVLEQLPGLRSTLVVVNNQGGKIFSRMFAAREFQNHHQVEFSSWARLWKLPYERWDAIPDGDLANPSHRIVELAPDEAATARFWKAYEELCR